MSERVEVYLLRTIQHGYTENGVRKRVTFKPGNFNQGERKVTKLPKFLFDQLKDADPVVFIPVEKTIVDSGDEEVVLTDVQQVKLTAQQEAINAEGIKVEETSEEDFDDEALEAQGEGSEPLSGIEEGGEDTAEGTEPETKTAPVPEPASGELTESQKLLADELEKVNYIGKNLATALVKAGYNTPGDVAVASVEDLVKVSYIGEGNVNEVKAAALEYIEG